MKGQNSMEKKKKKNRKLGKFLSILGPTTLPALPPLDFFLIFSTKYCFLSFSNCCFFLFPFRDSTCDLYYYSGIVMGHQKYL